MASNPESCDLKIEMGNPSFSQAAALIGLAFLFLRGVKPVRREFATTYRSFFRPLSFRRIVLFLYKYYYVVILVLLCTF